ncbi:Nif3-like dinuclear metal center hexameric protein [Nocardiopsis coralliicola]
MTTSTPHLRDVVDAFDTLYPPAWAASWDAVGLAAGDPAAPVRRVLFAVDPDPAVVEEAADWGADLIVTHHPLLLRGVHSVAADTPKGRLVHRLISSGIALFTAHTNADTADPGVSDALAAAVGVTGPLRPLSPDPGDPQGRRGIGRIGRLERPVPLREFAAAAAAGLPRTAGGVRVAGDLDRTVATVAVSGGSGDGLLAEARAAGVDAYLTSDLRHHPASEHLQHSLDADAPALLDVAHWAGEHPWLDDGAARLRAALAARGAAVETRVSTTVTDAWTQAL